jgi:hypothetical protein
MISHKQRFRGLHFAECRHSPICYVVWAGVLAQRKHSFYRALPSTLLPNAWTRPKRL